MSSYESYKAGIDQQSIAYLNSKIAELTDELVNIEAVAKDRYCTMQTENERLQINCDMYEAEVRGCWNRSRELEAALRKIASMDDMLNEAQMAIVAEEALKGSKP
jgi:predicted RNase H-like nuclease (RuvC/YqgF family)